jgi:hypothetical protein
MTTQLQELYSKAADAAIADGCTADDSPNGCISQWVQKNVNYREDTLFFIVLGICAEIADREARAEGFENNIDKAAKLAFAKLWCQLGEGGELQSLNNVSEATVYLNELGAGQVTEWAATGFDTPNYHGDDRVLMFWGGNDGTFYRALNEAERQYVQSAMQGVLN